MEYFGRKNSAKGKCRNPSQFYLFSFPAWKETELATIFETGKFMGEICVPNYT